MIRIVLVDDEPLAREGLRRRLEREVDVSIVGEAASGSDAIELVRSQMPDAIYLDIQMPGLDGFETLARLASIHLPIVVFVTAFEAHAIRAFEVHALDYLLKPIDDARLSESLRRVRRELALGEMSAEPERVARMLESRDPAAPADTGGEPALHAPGATAVRRFVVRDRGRFRLVPIEAVQWIESAGNYVQIHTAEGAELVRMTLANAESATRAAGFVRVHRSVLLRPESVRSIRATGNGDFVVVLSGGTEVPMSRRFRGALLGR